MFHDIDAKIIDRMKWLEELDTRDRLDGTPRMKRLRQIPPDTGRFLAMLVAAAPKGNVIEIGTSAGYSTLWLYLGCRESDKKIATYEILDDKAAMAHETFLAAGISDRVTLHHGDALDAIKDFDKISFCFLDAEKEDYKKFYEMVIPKLVPGGLLVADNVISHVEALGAVVDLAARDNSIDSVVVPIGKGELVCRKINSR